MTAGAAGISQRAFFNSYPNKEAAIVGRPAELDPALLERFATSRQPLTRNLLDLMAAHCRQAAPRKEVVRAIVALTGEQPHLGLAFIDSMRRQAAHLADAIALRMEPDSRQLAEHLADTLIRAIGLTFYYWAHHPDQNIEAAIADTRKRLGQIGELLCNAASG